MYKKPTRPNVSDEQDDDDVEVTLDVHDSQLGATGDDL
jgi:hypothetical protein